MLHNMDAAPSQADTLNPVVAVVLIISVVIFAGILGSDDPVTESELESICGENKCYDDGLEVLAHSFVFKRYEHERTHDHM